MTIAKRYERYFDPKTGKVRNTVRRALEWCVGDMDYTQADVLMCHDLKLGYEFNSLWCHTVDQLCKQPAGKVKSAPWEAVIQQWRIRDIEQAIALHRKYCYDPVREFAEGHSVNQVPK